jgi:hypothetical protein
LPLCGDGLGLEVFGEHHHHATINEGFYEPIAVKGFPIQDEQGSAWNRDRCMRVVLSNQAKEWTRGAVLAVQNGFLFSNARANTATLQDWRLQSTTLLQMSSRSASSARAISGPRYKEERPGMKWLKRKDARFG